MAYVIEFRNGTYFKDSESDNGTTSNKAKKFGTKEECDIIMRDNPWILFNGGMRVDVGLWES